MARDQQQDRASGFLRPTGIFFSSVLSLTLYTLLFCHFYLLVVQWAISFFFQLRPKHRTNDGKDVAKLIFDSLSALQCTLMHSITEELLYWIRKKGTHFVLFLTLAFSPEQIEEVLSLPKYSLGASLFYQWVTTTWNDKKKVENKCGEQTYFFQEISVKPEGFICAKQKWSKVTLWICILDSLSDLVYERDGLCSVFAGAGIIVKHKYLYLCLSFHSKVDAAS